MTKIRIQIDAESLRVASQMAEERALAEEYEFETSWAPVDLGLVLSGSATTELPSVWTRSDGEALLYRRKVNAIFAETESGKTWMALDASAQEIRGGQHVFYVDFEDSPSGIVERLRAMGVPDETIEGFFHYLRPEDPIERDFVQDLLSIYSPSLVVLDGITEAMNIHGKSILDNDDAAEFMRILPRMLKESGAAVLLLDHVTKSKDRTKGPVGAQHKLSALDGASYLATVDRPFGRGQCGVVRLDVAKDRPGHVRAIAQESKRVGRFFVEPDGNGVHVAVEAPSEHRKIVVSPDAVDHELADRVLGVIRDSEPEWKNQSTICKEVGRQKARVIAVLNYLESERKIETKAGDRTEKLYRTLST